MTDFKKLKGAGHEAYCDFVVWALSDPQCGVAQYIPKVQQKTFKAATQMFEHHLDMVTIEKKHGYQSIVSGRSPGNAKSAGGLLFRAANRQMGTFANLEEALVEAHFGKLDAEQVRIQVRQQVNKLESKVFGTDR